MNPIDDDLLNAPVFDVLPLVRETFSRAIDKYGNAELAAMLRVSEETVMFWADIPEDADEHELPPSKVLKALKCRLLSDMGVN